MSTSAARARRRLLRGALAAAAALLLALAAAAQARALRREQRARIDEARALGLLERHPGLARALSREADPQRGRLLLARALVEDELDPSWRGELAPAAAVTAAAQAPARLERAHALAATALRRRPASAEASTLVGLTTFLDRRQRRDPRLYADLDAWAAPLRAAVERAPADPRPRGALAAGYLEVWFALAAAERQAALPVLRQALADPETFRRLLPRWLRAARDADELAVVLPDRAEDWRRVAASHAQQGDWPAFLAAHGAAERALERELEATLERGATLLAAGDLGAARAELLRVATRTRPQRRWAPLLERALERCPPGLVAGRDREAIQAWLRWALDARLYGDAPLAPPIVGRLAGLAGKVPDHEAALAALAAEELSRAELLERRSGDLWGEAWGPYLMVKAEVLARRRDLVGARAALGRVHRDWHASPLFARAAEALDRADGAAAKTASTAAAERRTRWEATAWTYRRGQPRLELLAPAGPARLTLAFDAVPAAGGVVEVYWDGAALGPFAVAPEGAVAARVEVAPGPHLVTLESLAGGVTPGAVTLLPEAPAPGDPERRAARR